jgi:GNAT superfamily N-acetyltransferase
MADSAPPPLAIYLECVSWPLVKHHQRHGALRFDAAASAYLASLVASEPASHFCIATVADDPIAVAGLLHYRLAPDDLHFVHILVRDDCRRRGIGRRMIAEVVLHPTCIQLSRVHWPAVTGECAGLLHHLEWLRDNVRRLCGTPFELLIDRPERANSVGERSAR